jgi:hypothetical protein
VGFVESFPGSSRRICAERRPWLSPKALLPSLLTQNQHLAPSTQQAKRSWLNTRVGSEAWQSIFLKLTKDET